MKKDKDRNRQTIVSSNEIHSFNWQEKSSQCLMRIFLIILLKFVSDENLAQQKIVSNDGQYQQSDI